MLTVTPVDQVRPNDHLLREAEDAEATALERVVEDVARVGHHALALEDAQADEADGGPVQQQPAVRRLFLPADVPRVLPQQPYL